MASGGENYGYSGKNNTIEVSGWSNGNSVGNIRDTGDANGNKISAQYSTQEQQSGPVPSPRSEVQPSSGGNYGYSESGDNNRNSLGNIRNIMSNTGMGGSRNKISTQSAQEQLSAPVPSPRSGVQPFSEGNYGYSASDGNKISVSGWSKGNPMGNIKNNPTEVSGWSNGNSSRNISNSTGDGNGNKISAQSAQEQQSAPPVPSTPRSGVQPSSGGNYGYNTIGDNNRKSVGNNIGNISNTGVENRNKIISEQLAQEQQSAQVPSLRIGLQTSSGAGNYRYSASEDNQVGNIGNSTGVEKVNKISAQSVQEQLSAPPVPYPWSGGNYGYSASGDNKMSVSGWNKGNSVGNIRNTGVGSNNEESTPRSSCCSCLMCS